MKVDEHTPLLDLVQQLRSHDANQMRHAENELFSRTRRFVQFVIRQSRGDCHRNRLTTQGLTNAIEKSFLSYIRKPRDWEGQDVPKDKIILSILATITTRYVAREMSRLANRPREDHDDFNDLIGSVEDYAVQPLEEFEFVEFLEEIKNAVRDTADVAIRVLELRLEGFSSVEIQEELGIGRGKLAHVVKEIKRRVLLVYLDRQNPDQARAYREYENLARGRSRTESGVDYFRIVAAKIGCSEEWVQKSIARVTSMLKS